MKTRLIGAVVALVLALVGTVIIVTYVSGAESRAFAGTEPTDILVVAKTVPEGTVGEDLAKLVRVEAVPAKVVAKDSVTKIEELAGLVASADLVPGEQLLSSRFVDPATLVAQGQVAVPDGMQELTVQLAPERVVGGNLAAGDSVGVYVSVEGKGEDDAGWTHHIFHAVLVTNVQGGAAPVPETEDEDESSDTATTPAPEGELLVTLATKAADAEDIVWGREFGRLWLTKEPKEADDSGTKVTTEQDLMR